MASRLFKRIPFDVTITQGTPDIILATVPASTTWLINKWLDQNVTVTGGPFNYEIQHRDSGTTVLNILEDVVGATVEGVSSQLVLPKGINAEAGDDFFLDGALPGGTQVLRLRGAIYVLEIKP